MAGGVLFFVGKSQAIASGRKSRSTANSIYVASRAWQAVFLCYNPAHAARGLRISQAADRFSGENMRLALCVFHCLLFAAIVSAQTGDTTGPKRPPAECPQEIDVNSDKPMKAVTSLPPKRCKVIKKNRKRMLQRAHQLGAAIHTSMKK